MNAHKGLMLLAEGNARFVEGMIRQRDMLVDREGIANKQAPFAVIVSCSDSRVSPEIVFDCGLGELFVIRSAGEVIDHAGVGSIEYAVKHLGVELIVVLGHQRCGAVTAAFESAAEEGDIASLVLAIKPAIEGCKDLDEAIHAQTNWTVKQLKHNNLLMKARVVGAYYNLDTGEVKLGEIKNENRR